MVHEQAILDWIASAKARIANAPPEEDEEDGEGESEGKKEEEGKAAAAEGSYGDEEDYDYEDGEDGQVSIKAMKMFVSGVSVIMYYLQAPC